jgi:hypothetical protein
MTQTKRKTAKSPGLRMYQEDVDLIAKLKSRLEPRMGPRTLADVIRMGLRSLDRELEAEATKR